MCAQRAKYQEALEAYTRCLEAFSMALKWEKNEAIIKTFKNFALEYMTRAEKIKKMLSEPVPEKKKKAAEGGDKDKDKDKMRDAVESAIVQEKPNVKWGDIAGLEQVALALSPCLSLHRCRWRCPDLWVHHSRSLACSRPFLSCTYVKTDGSCFQ